MSNILITGGCGYIGSRVVEQFIRHTNHNLIIFDSGLFGFNSISDFMDSDRVQLIIGDIRIQEELQKAMKNVDIVIHLAGIVGEPACTVDEDISHDINVLGTQNVLKSAKKSGVKEFLFASSCSVYGFGNEVFFENSIPNPVDSYAEMKLASELDIENYKETMRISILRFCTVFGASNRMRFDLAVNIMTANAVVNNEIQVYGGQQERPFIHCSDIARAVELVIQRRHIDQVYNPGLEIYNIGNNKLNYNLTSIAKIISDEVGNVPINFDGDKEDNRNYKVNFDKIESLGFVTEKSIRDGVKEIKDSIIQKEILNPYDAQYSNIKIAKNDYL